MNDRKILKYDTTFKRKCYESQQETDVSSDMYYLKFTFKGPEYGRNIVFYDSLKDFLKY